LNYLLIELRTNAMKFINSVSLTLDSKDWLAISRHPRVLHVFDHACNLIDERREVLSIVNQQIGNGPFNLVIEGDILFSDFLSLQSPVSFSATQLNIGEIDIYTVDAKLWHPRPAWGMLHARRDDILNQIMSFGGRWFSARSNPLDNWEIASSQRASALLATTLPVTNYQSLSSNLSTALTIANLTSSLTAAKQLAGLGIGLTPAGDDFVLGAVLAAWIIHPPETAGALAGEITNIAAPLTTSLSAAWLRSAGKGEAGILWHNFFDALIAGSSVKIQETMSKILAVGETSGADALAGFIGTFNSYAEQAK
jgi:hypothetical protein